MAKQETLLWRLLRAADRACIARAEAQWTNGYRASIEGSVNVNGRLTAAEQQRLYDKEQAQWKRVGRVEGQMRRVFQAVLRDARKGNAKSRRHADDVTNREGNHGNG